MKYKTEKPPFLEKSDEKKRPELFVADKDGVYPSEMWSLDVCIACFLVPRLKFYRKNLSSFPNGLSEKKWDNILNKIIECFEIIAGEKYWDWEDKENAKKVKAGTKLFAKYFSNLWD